MYIDYGHVKFYNSVGKIAIPWRSCQFDVSVSVAILLQLYQQTIKIAKLSHCKALCMTSGGITAPGT